MDRYGLDQYRLRVTTELTGDIYTVLAAQRRVIEALGEIGGLSSAVEISFESVAGAEPMSDEEIADGELAIKPFDASETSFAINPEEMARLDMDVDSFLKTFSGRSQSYPLTRLHQAGVYRARDFLVIAKNGTADIPQIGSALRDGIAAALGRAFPSIPFTEEPDMTVIAHICPTLAHVTDGLVAGYHQPIEEEVTGRSIQDILTMTPEIIVRRYNFRARFGEPNLEGVRAFLLTARRTVRQFLAEQSRIARSTQAT